MKFGIFMAPFHRVGENPSLAFERDMQLIESLDELGYDEAFVGEHHSAGWEIIPSPEIFMAVAATRTKRIMLGSGVVSVPYHHPFNIANRFAMLDQLDARARRLADRPGALPSDAYMLGIEPTTQRDAMVEGLSAVMRLFNEEGGITIVMDRIFKMREAHLQVKPFQQPHLPIFVANSISPSGMVARWPISDAASCRLLPSAARVRVLDNLPKRWQTAEETAAENGKTWWTARIGGDLSGPYRRVRRKKLVDDIRVKAATPDSGIFSSRLSPPKFSLRNIRISQTEEMTIDRMVARGGALWSRTLDEVIKRINDIVLRPQAVVSAAFWYSPTNGPHAKRRCIPTRCWRVT